MLPSYGPIKRNQVLQPLFSLGIQGEGNKQDRGGADKREIPVQRWLFPLLVRT